MKGVLAVSAVAAVFLVSAMDEAWAHGRRGGGARASGHRHHHHHGSRVFLHAAPAFIYPRPYYAYPPPTYSPYYYPPAPIQYAPPPVYMERYDGAPSSRSQYWYFCPNTSAYYPDVQECAGGWQRMLPPQPVG